VIYWAVKSALIFILEYSHSSALAHLQRPHTLIDPIHASLIEQIIAQLDSPSNINKFIESSMQSFGSDKAKISQFTLELSKVFAPMHSPSHIEEWNEIRAQDHCPQERYLQFLMVF
jgi:hypothetical protein